MLPTGSETEEPRHDRGLAVRSPASLSPRPDRVTAGEAPGFLFSAWLQPVAALPGGPMIMNAPAGPCLQRRTNKHTSGEGEGEGGTEMACCCPTSEVETRPRQIRTKTKPGSPFVGGKTPVLGTTGVALLAASTCIRGLGRSWAAVGTLDPDFSGSQQRFLISPWATRLKARDGVRGAFASGQDAGFQGARLAYLDPLSFSAFCSWGAVGPP